MYCWVGTRALLGRDACIVHSIDSPPSSCTYTPSRSPRTPIRAPRISHYARNDIFSFRETGIFLEEIQRKYSCFYVIFFQMGVGVKAGLGEAARGGNLFGL